MFFVCFLFCFEDMTICIYDVTTTQTSRHITHGCPKRNAIYNTNSTDDLTFNVQQVN